MRPKSLSLLLLLFLLPVTLAAQSPKDRVWLGVSAEEGNAATSVTLVEVIPESPAAKGGLKVGDQILEVGRSKIKDLDGFMEIVKAKSPGSTQAFAIKRKGKTLRLRVRLGSQAERVALEKRNRDRAKARVAKKSQPRAAKPRGKGRLGVELQEDGMVIQITKVDAGGPAAKAGLQRGDVIVKARGRDVKDLDLFINDIQKTGAGAQYPLEIRRRGQVKKLTARLGGYRDQPAEPGRMGAPMAAKKAPKKGKKKSQPSKYAGRGKQAPIVARVVAQAKKQGRLALIIFFDPESEASKLTGKSLADPKVKKILQKGYVGTKVNVLEQARVADQYGVMATPHFQVLTGEGRTMGRFTGYLPPARLAARLQRYVNTAHKNAPRDSARTAAKPKSRPAGKAKDQPRRVEARPSTASEVQRNQRILRQMQGERRRMEKLLKEMKQIEQRLKNRK